MVEKAVEKSPYIQAEDFCERTLGRGVIEGLEGRKRFASPFHTSILQEGKEGRRARIGFLLPLGLRRKLAANGVGTLFDLLNLPEKEIKARVEPDDFRIIEEEVDHFIKELRISPERKLLEFIFPELPNRRLRNLTVEAEDLLRFAVQAVLDDLPVQEASLLRCEFGIYDGIRRSLKETGELLGIKNPMVIEGSAITDLHSQSAPYKVPTWKRLKGFFWEYDPKEASVKASVVHSAKVQRQELGIERQEKYPDILLHGDAESYLRRLITGLYQNPGLEKKLDDLTREQYKKQYGQE